MIYMGYADGMRQVITIVIILAVASCGWFKATKDPTEGWSAERLYEYAKGKLDQGNYTDAIEYYEKLEARYPFGIYGQQALLDVAYAYYKNEEPDSAIATCERFIKLYPQHPHVDYAYYLKGLSNFNRGKKLIHVYLPLDLSQRDPGSALQAFRDFQVLVKNYPDSIYDEDAKLRMLYLRNMLARYEVNVAHYYMRRSAYLAAANRSRYVIENYPRATAVPDALAVMCKAYKVMGLDELSDDALRVLKTNYPEHPEIAELDSIVIQ